MSKAGLEKLLMKGSTDGTLPPILLIEEFEKVVEPKIVNSLIQVMDTRGVIQRTNARDGNEYGQCKELVWGTCNDSDHLRGFAKGAIWSRFSLKPIFKRPSPNTMKKILMRVCDDVEKEGGYCGSEDHVDIIVDFMWNEVKQMPEYAKDYNDPRLGRALLSGGDRILDGDFLKDFIKVCGGTELGED